MAKKFNNWLIPLFVFGVPMFFVLLGLAKWQYDRALEKQIINERIQLADSATAVSAGDISLEADSALHLRRFGVVAEVDERVLFLDNKTRSGKVGVELIQPVLLDSGWILVNFGWLPWQRSDRLPSVVADVTRITGRLSLWPSERFHLGEQKYTEDLPKLIQWLEYDRLMKYFDNRLLPYIVYMDEDANQAFITDWKFKGGVSVVTHYGYAAQWLALALVLACLLGYCAIRKSHIDQK